MTNEDKIKAALHFFLHVKIVDAQDDDRIDHWAVLHKALTDHKRAQPASDEEWLKHPQTIKAREQWCVVAKALGADPDDPDAVLRAAQPASALHILFDGPPGPTAGRFVEVEDDFGESLNVGEWKRRDDGLWELVIQRAQPASVPREQVIALLETAIEKMGSVNAVYEMLLKTRPPKEGA